MRVVSLVPSLTHMLCDFGLREQLVGCTVFCIEPPGLARSVEMIGGTKDPDIEKIARLKPTLILANVEENKPEHIALCREIAPTVATFPKRPEDVPAMLSELGAQLGVADVGKRAADDVQAALAALKAAVRDAAWQPRRYLYYIWREPYMVVSSDTYISAMLSLLGFENAAPSSVRYPTLTVDEARTLAPDLVLLSTEPYPFRRRDAARLRGEWPDVPEILKIDGQLLSWYGTMTVPALQELTKWVKGAPQKLVAPL